MHPWRHWPEAAAALLLACLGSLSACGQGYITPTPDGDADADGDADGEGDGDLPGCGDGTCSASESAARCPEDCPAQCGDGLCTHDETGSTCPVDCWGGVCGDGACAAGEDEASCPEDCAGSCGDGACTAEETAETCPADCDGACGDDLCSEGEDASSCPADCPATCGDGLCTHSETTASCAADCPATCGDGLCAGDETTASCPADCSPTCGDGDCVGSESAASCPADCPALCGDGACTHAEEACSCAADCPASCGDGCCTHAETSGSCPVDCGGGTAGHAVLIGHDFYASNASQDRVVGNAVFLAGTTGTVRVLAYTQYSDNSATGEAAYTDAAISSTATSLGRSWSRTALTSSDALASTLPGHDVLLVYEQEATTIATLRTIGSSWASALSSFVAGGGVVVVCDYLGSSGGTWEILNSSGLMSVSGSASITGATISVVAPTDPVAAGVPASYAAADGSLRFVSSESVVVVSDGSGPVVIHRRF